MSWEIQIGKRKDIKFFFGAQGQTLKDQSTSTNAAATVANDNSNSEQNTPASSVLQGPHRVAEEQEEEDKEERQSLQAILDNLDDIEHGWDQSHETSE